MEKHSDAENQEIAELRWQLKKSQEEKEQLKEKSLILKEENLMLKEENLMLKEKNKELKEENLMLKEGKLPGPADIQLPQANFPNLKPPVKPATSPHLIKPTVSSNSQGQKKEEELKVNIPMKSWLSYVNSELSALERPGAVTHLSIAFDNVLTTTRSVSHRGFRGKSGRMQCKPSGIQT